MAIYEDTINPIKAFFTFSLISTPYFNAFVSRHDLEHVPKDSHVASKSVLFKLIFKLMQQPGESKKVYMFHEPLKVTMASNVKISLGSYIRNLKLGY